MPHPKELNRTKVADLEGFGLEIWKVHVDALKEQKTNARVMSNKLFERLVKNVGDDKRLESLPFCYQNDEGQFEIISGHHRIRSARVAGITEIFVLVDPKHLTKDEVVSKQLAHNAIAGQDDTQILADLYTKIENVLERAKTGIDAESLKLNQFNPVSLQGLSFKFDTRTILLTFLPTGYNRVEEAMKCVEKRDQIALAHADDFQPFVDTLKQVSANENVRNVSAVLLRMCEIVKEHYANVDGAVDGKDAELEDDAKTES